MQVLKPEGASVEEAPNLVTISSGKFRILLQW